MTGLTMFRFEWCNKILTMTLPRRCSKEDIKKNNKIKKLKVLSRDSWVMKFYTCYDYMAGGLFIFRFRAFHPIAFPCPLKKKIHSSARVDQILTTVVKSGNKKKQKGCQCNDLTAWSSRIVTQPKSYFYKICCF